MVTAALVKGHVTCPANGEPARRANRAHDRGRGTRGGREVLLCRCGDSAEHEHRGANATVVPRCCNRRTARPSWIESRAPAESGPRRSRLGGRGRPSRSHGGAPAREDPMMITRYHLHEREPSTEAGAMSTRTMQPHPWGDGRTVETRGKLAGTSRGPASDARYEKSAGFATADSGASTSPTDARKWRNWQTRDRFQYPGGVGVQRHTLAPVVRAWRGLGSDQTA